MAKTIGLDKLRKDNSNLWRVEGIGPVLKEELKKLNFKKVTKDHLDKLKNWAVVTEYGRVDSYQDIDSRLDMMKFAETLPDGYREVFDLLMENMDVNEMSRELGVHKQTLYPKLRLISQLYREFCED